MTTVLRFAEKEYYSSKLEQCKHNIKATWNVLNTVIKKQMSSSELPSEFEDSNGKTVKGKQHIANGFNDFFC